jgi:hypothetical protein
MQNNAQMLMQYLKLDMTFSPSAEQAVWIFRLFQRT